MANQNFLNKKQSAFVYALVCLFFFVFAYHRTSWGTVRSPEEGGSYDTITIVRPAIERTLFGVSAILAMTLLFAGVLALVRPTLRYPGFAVALAVLGFPSACIAHFLNNLAPWTQHGQVTTADGNTYVFCNSSFLMGQTMAITHVTHESLLLKHFAVLVNNNGDSPRSWASVIRPAGAVDSYGQLYLGPDDLLVGCRYTNRAYVAFNLRTQIAYGHGDIERLSPFVCLGVDSDLHLKDIPNTVQRIVEAASQTAGGQSFPGVPSEATLIDGLTNANPRVQAAARELLDARGEAINLKRPAAAQQILAPED